jgi:release factor glutamine methyltransferase
MLVREAVGWAATQFVAAGIEDSWVNAVFLMKHALQSPPESALDKSLEPQQEVLFRGWVSARSRRMPAQYLVGIQDFYGRPFFVSRTVFVPRSYTEEYVAVVLEELTKDTRPTLNVVEVGTGSGAVATTLAAENSKVSATAFDVSEATVEIARNNALAHQVAGRTTFLTDDWQDFLKNGALRDLACVIGNPPDRTPAEVQTLVPETRHEPQRALTNGTNDPLADHRAIIRSAKGSLAAGGFVALDVHPPRAQELEQIFHAEGFQTRLVPGSEDVYPVTLVGRLPHRQ